MAFRVYSGPSGTDMFDPIDKDRMLFKQLGTLDEAISWARHLSREGKSVLLIEGDDGTSLTKSQIASAFTQDEGDARIKPHAL